MSSVLQLILLLLWVEMVRGRLRTGPKMAASAKALEVPHTKEYEDDEKPSKDDYKTLQLSRMAFS